MRKKPARLTSHYRRVVFRRIGGKRLRDEDAGVVDKRVDAAEPGDGFGDHALSGLRISDIAGNGENFIVVRRLDRAGGRHYAVVAVTVGLHKGRADTLRCAGNDCYFLFGTHG